MSWEILTDNEPVSLENRDLKLVMTGPMGNSKELTFTVSGNILSFDLPGKEQKTCGFYDFTLWENKDGSEQKVVDVYHDLELVPHSYLEKD